MRQWAQRPLHWHTTTLSNIAHTTAWCEYWEHLRIIALKQTYFQEWPESAVCVQRSLDSRNSAIHGAYRILLRPSSLLEPRHPSLKVVIGSENPQTQKTILEKFGVRLSHDIQLRPHAKCNRSQLPTRTIQLYSFHDLTVWFRFWSGYIYRVNDPSAGSPTETLLRLLLPLSDKVH